MLCGCGCGKETKLASRTFKSKGLIAGQPCRFLPGHAGGMASRRDRMTSELWTITDCGHDTPCWVWNGSRKNQWGHCAVWIGGKEYSAHRRLYEQEVGPIPDGLELDHLCSNPPCVNPHHLEPVSHAENIRRSPLAKLTWEQVEAIRASPLSTRKAAPLFGVTASTISSVRRRDTWA